MNPIGAGERVTWMNKRITLGGARIEFSSRSGRVLEVRENSALVKPERGKAVWIPLNHLTPANERSAVGRIFDHIAASIN